MKWNQIHKRIRSMLAHTILDRFTLGTTSYRRSHDQIGRGWIAIDGSEILNLPSLDFEIEAYGRSRNPNANYEEMARELHNLNLLHESLESSGASEQQRIDRRGEMPEALRGILCELL